MRRAWAACTIVLAACIDTSGLGFDLGPVEHVDVFPPEASMRVGDSAHLYAAGYNRVGSITHLAATRTWQVSDTSLVSVRALVPSGDSVSLLAKRPGVVRVEAHIEGVAGAATVTVVASSASLHLTNEAPKLGHIENAP